MKELNRRAINAPQPCIQSSRLNPTESATHAIERELPSCWNVNYINSPQSFRKRDLKKCVLVSRLMRRSFGVITIAGYIV